MEFNVGDRVYCTETKKYGTVYDIADIVQGYLTIQYDDGNFGYMRDIEQLVAEAFDPISMGQFLASGLIGGVTAEQKESPWATIRQLLKNGFNWWYNDFAPKIVKDDLTNLRNVLRSAETSLGYDPNSLEGIWENGWEYQEPDLPVPPETPLQWQEEPIEEMADKFYTFIFNSIKSSAASMQINDWRSLVSDAYDSWVLHNAPSSVKYDENKMVELQQLVTKRGIDIQGIGTADWWLRHQGKEVAAPPEGDWIKDIEREVGRPERLEQTLKQWKIGDEVYDSVHKQNGYVVDTWDGRVLIRYYDGVTRTVDADELYAEKPPSVEEMGDMFKWERKAAQVNILLKKIATTPLVITKRPQKKTKHLLTQLVKTGFLQARKGKDKVVFGLTKKGREFVAQIPGEETGHEDESIWVSKQRQAQREGALNSIVTMITNYFNVFVDYLGGEYPDIEEEKLADMVYAEIDYTISGMDDIATENILERLIKEGHQSKSDKEFEEARQRRREKREQGPDISDRFKFSKKHKAQIIHHDIEEENVEITNQPEHDGVQTGHWFNDYHGTWYEVEWDDGTKSFMIGEPKEDEEDRFRQYVRGVADSLTEYDYRHVPWEIVKHVVEECIRKVLQNTPWEDENFDEDVNEMVTDDLNFDYAPFYIYEELDKEGRLDINKPIKYTFPDGRIIYKTLNDELHREDGPAEIRPNGYQAYYIHGKKHREGAPAVTRENGTIEYWINGQLHRESGPAIVYSDGAKEYYIDGRNITDPDKIREMEIPDISNRFKFSELDKFLAM